MLLRFFLSDGPLLLRVVQTLLHLVEDVKVVLNVLQCAVLRKLL